VANLEADHKEDDKEDEHAGEDDVAGEGERVRGNQLAVDVLDTGQLPPPGPPRQEAPAHCGVEPKEVVSPQGGGGARRDHEETSARDPPVSRDPDVKHGDVEAGEAELDPEVAPAQLSSGEF